MKKPRIRFYLKKENFDYFETLTLLWSEKLKIVSVTLLFFVSALSFSVFLPNMYLSSAILKVVEAKGNNSELSSITSRYGGIASMAGISLPSTNSDGNFVVETIKSKDFLQHLLRFEDVENKLIDTNKSNQSFLDIYGTYEEALSIFIEKDTSFINLSFLHRDPVFASNFLKLIVAEINAITRSKDLKEAEDALQFLQEQIALTEKSSTRQAINMLIENELKTKMFVNIRNDYVVTYIDTPYVPESRYSPKRSLICMIGSMIGLLFSVLVVLLRNFIGIREE